MARSVQTSTTSSIPGWEVESSLGVVSTHVVAGTNIFSDIAGGLSNIFGGRSRSYQKQLASIDQEVIEQLKEKAERMGANCIIGLRVDHDEISGGGKSMFMVTACGTAAVATQVREGGDVHSSVSSLDADAVATAVDRAKVIDEAREGRLAFTDDDWEFITRERVHEVLDAVCEHAAEELKMYRDEQTVAARLEQYLGSLSRDQAVEGAYRLAAHPHHRVRPHARELIDRLYLLDLDRVEQLLESEHVEIRRDALRILKNAQKDRYDQSDLAHLEQMLDAGLSRFFPQLGETFEKEKMLGSGTVSKWKCRSGHTNNGDVTYCTDCTEDIYGLRRSDVYPKDVADELMWLVAVLREQLATTDEPPAQVEAESSATVTS